MKVTRLSSTSLETAMTCLARFKVQYVDYVKGPQNTAASFGTCVHDTLEYYVTLAYRDKQIEPTWDQLLNIWMLKFSEHFGSLTASKTDLKLGETILKRWHDRGDLDQEGRELIELENKKHFSITVDGTEITFTYIIDRLDKMPDGSYKVVDYKTNAWAINADELRDIKIQPRMYALATQIEHPEAPGIWVEFDMLKHENQPVGVYFSQEDNKQTWLGLKKEIRKILQAPDNPKPTLNDTCLFCPIKATCPAVTSLAHAGGFAALDQAEMVDRLVKLDQQAKAVKAAREELEKHLLALAKDADVEELEGNQEAVQVAISKTRKVDAERIERIIGPHLWGKYGATSIAMSTIDILLKGDELTAEAKAEMRGMITINRGEPRLKPKKKSGLV